MQDFLSWWVQDVCRHEKEQKRLTTDKVGHCMAAQLLYRVLSLRQLSLRHVGQMTSKDHSQYF